MNLKLHNLTYTTDNRRTQRVLPKEEEVLLGAANPQMQMLIIMALDAGLRRRELLKLSCGDTDLTQQLIHIGLDPVS